MRILLRALLLCFAVAAATAAERFSQQDIDRIATALTPFIETELRDKKIPGAAIALVDDQRILWSKSFGNVQSNPVIRAGSVSKLFNAVLVMQQVEAGKLDLDAPIANYLPTFHPTNRFLGHDITLRQLLSHRSGLARESPYGNYFEPEQSSLRKTVESMNATEVVYEPGTRVKYSNAGVAIAGYIAELAGGKPHAKRMQRDVLDRIGMTNSAFTLEKRLLNQMAEGQMWTLHGTTSKAPVFQWGLSPAASLNTTVEDLAKFASALFADADGANKLLKKETLAEMWRPQYEGRGFGLGFATGQFNGHKRVSHNGAVFGFATEFTLLPEQKLAVAVCVTKDFANTVGGRIAAAGLNQLLSNDAKVPVQNKSLDREQIRAWRGRFASGEKKIDLVEFGGRLCLKRDRIPVALRFDGTNFIGDSELGYGPVLKLGANPNEFTIGNDTYRRERRAMPAVIPAPWEEYIGEYGWDYDILCVFEADGKINVLFEWFEFSALEEIAKDIFQFPDDGFYAGEKLVFTRDKKGRITEAIAANVHFKRREVSTPRIKPANDVRKLLTQAATEKPPIFEGNFQKSELVDLATIDHTFHFDVRYAGTNNFLGVPFYNDAKVFLQKPAAEALRRVSENLRPLGYGLRIFDGYRPWSITKVFWEATPAKFRAFVADPKKGSRHNRGAAVDLTLYELATGNEIEMPGKYDEMSDRSYVTYPGGTDRQRWHRDLLREAMESEGFRALHNEWWHYDHELWRDYPILNEQHGGER